MTSADFQAWHRRMGYTYEAGAAVLGVSRATYARYLRDPEPPLWLAWACAAIEANLKPLGLQQVQPV